MVAIDLTPPPIDQTIPLRQAEVEQLMGKLRTECGWSEEEQLDQLARADLCSVLTDYVRDRPDPERYLLRDTDYFRRRVDFVEKAMRALRTERWLAFLNDQQARVQTRLAKRVASATSEACQALNQAAELDGETRLSLLHPKLQEWCRSVDANTGGLLLGPTSVGKSIGVVEAISRMYAADCETQIADMVQRREPLDPPRLRGLVFVAASDIARCMSYGQPGDDGHGALSRAQQAKWLAIDDLGWEPATGRPAIREVLSHRYDHGLATVMTSGWTLDALRAEYGDALLRRAIQCRGRQGQVIDLWEVAT